MSIDENVTENLVQTLEDGRNGYAQAADKLAEDNPEAASTFRELSTQRAQFSQELRGLAGAYGDEIDESGSAAAALHRGWISLRDAINGSNPDGVFAAVKQGENHAVSEFENALGEDISDGLRLVAQRQLGDITVARDGVERLLSSST